MGNLKIPREEFRQITSPNVRSTVFREAVGYDEYDDSPEHRKIYAKIAKIIEQNPSASTKEIIILAKQALR